MLLGGLKLKNMEIEFKKAKFTPNQIVIKKRRENIITTGTLHIIASCL